MVELMSQTPIRIHFTYCHTDKPWGGANNFIRALNMELFNSKKYELIGSINDDCDIIFMNQLGAGPCGDGKDLSLQLIKELKEKSNFKKKIVVRAVNLNWHAHNHGLRNLIWGRWSDRQTVALLNIADIVIFQSAYQRDFFINAGYKNNNSNLVIHNGADKSFWCENPICPELTGGPLKLISSTASPRKTKRHDLIAKLSILDGVEIRHLGAWPKDVDSGKVELLGTLSRSEMVEEMKTCHYFLHTAIKDPCPNAIFESICMGLPVIYNPDIGSSSEIVAENGLPLNENNLDITLKQACVKLEELRETVLKNRSNYIICHSTNRYKEVFEGREKE
ncbi:MAG: glycosyltransferase involved in cell wall biosynthesis [Paraglaciecola sp.]|jgi:glycosyltransferase involved in cell wall biosynthesis